MSMIEAVELVCGKSRCVPPNAERDGYHWVRRFHGGPAIPLHWNATWHRNADRGWGTWGQPDREDQWEYLGPCPSPDDPMKNRPGRSPRDEAALAWTKYTDSLGAEIEQHSKNSDLQMERAIRAEAEIDRLLAALQRLLVAVTSSAIRGEDWETEIQSARTALKQ